MNLSRPTVRFESQQNVDLEAQHQTSAASSISDRPPTSRSPNIEPIKKPEKSIVAPIRSFTLRGAPQLPSLASLRSDDQGENHTPPNTASSNIRASIAKLESLLWEASQLVQHATIMGQDQVEEEPSKVKSLEQTRTNSKLQKAKSTTQKTLSRRSSALDSFHTARPTMKGITSLPVIKSPSAEPVLTLPSQSTENVA